MLIEEISDFEDEQAMALWETKPYSSINQEKIVTVLGKCGAGSRINVLKKWVWGQVFTLSIGFH